MTQTEHETHIYRVVNGANGDVVAIYPGDLDGAVLASRVAQASNAQAAVEHPEDPVAGQYYSERHDL